MEEVPTTVLICDDNPKDRRLIHTLLMSMKDREFVILDAENETAMKTALENEKIDVILLEILMQKKSGLKWLTNIVERKIAPVIVVTSYGNENISSKVRKMGAYDYICKDRLYAFKLHMAISAALRAWYIGEAGKSETGEPDSKDTDVAVLRGRIKVLEKRIQEYEAELAALRGGNGYSNTMRKMKQSFGLLKKSWESTIYAMARMVEERDPYIAGHQELVAKLARLIAVEMKLPERQVNGIKMAAMVHDIGKIFIPAEILSKPGPLSDIELKLIQAHPRAGYDILKTIEFPWPIAKIVLQHHERMNGSGYPMGLSGDEILMEAKIIGVADVIEAMISHRPHRAALGADKALEEIKRNRALLYDSSVVDTCLNIFTEGGFAVG